MDIKKFLDQHDRRPVFVPTFVERMQRRWHDLGNVLGPSIPTAWWSLASTFNAAAVGALGDQWHVRQEACGVGKSESLALWLSMLPTGDSPHGGHPGALIVVRTIQQAETMAQTINTHAKKEVARAHHGGNGAYPAQRLSPEQMIFTPVVVVCHAAYERGADDPLSRSGSIFRAFHAWRTSPTGYRRITVIDEAIDFISFTQVTLDDVDLLLQATDVPGSCCRQEVAAVRRLREFLFAEAEMEMEHREAQEKMEVVIFNEDGTSTTHPYQQRFSLLWGEQGLADVDLTPLREVLKSAPLDFKILRRKDPAEKAILRERLLDIVEAAQRTLRSWAFYAKEDARGDMGPSLYTASVLPGLQEIPSGQRPGVVVLDATASQSPMYPLFDAVVHPTPRNIRIYRNVTLHTAFLPAAGKRHLTNNAQREVPKLIDNLKTALKPHGERNLFVLTFKGVTPQLVGYKDSAGFKTLMVENYGNVNGRNDFTSCDAGCLFGVFRYPKTWSTALYFALQGPQGWRWFYSSEGKSIRRNLETGQIAAEAIQGLHRTIIRKCINNRGDCPKADLFLTLTDNPQGREILTRIITAMPGINVVNWAYSLETVTNLRKTNHDEMLLAYADAMAHGKHRASEVRDALGIGLKAWERLIEKIREKHSLLPGALKERGVTYTSDPARPRLGAFFVKA